MMKKFAIVGNPAAHSLSPKLFYAGYHLSDAQSDNSLNMSYSVLEGSNIEECIASLKEQGYSGANVTAPFKEAVMKFVTDADAVCKTIGAANLIKFEGNRVFGFNTDYTAVKRIADEFIGSKNGRLQNLKAFVIGCGGAGKAAALACKDAALQTYITNRTMSKAIEYAGKIGVQALDFERCNLMLKVLKEGGVAAGGNLLIIYTLPLQIEQFAPDSFTGATVVEANYKNPCINSGSGKQWLVYQAIEGFRLFTGLTPDENAMHSAL